MSDPIKMEFGLHDLHVIKRALSIASAKISADVRRAKKRDEQKRVRPGLLGGLAMEGGDYQGLLRKINAKIGP